MDKRNRKVPKRYQENSFFRPTSSRVSRPSAAPVSNILQSKLLENITVNQCSASAQSDSIFAVSCNQFYSKRKSNELRAVLDGKENKVLRHGADMEQSSKLIGNSVSKNEDAFPMEDGANATPRSSESSSQYLVDNVMEGQEGTCRAEYASVESVSELQPVQEGKENRVLPHEADIDLTCLTGKSSDDSESKNDDAFVMDDCELPEYRDFVDIVLAMTGCATPDCSFTSFFSEHEISTHQSDDREFNADRLGISSEVHGEISEVMELHVTGNLQAETASCSTTIASTSEFQERNKHAVDNVDTVSICQYNESEPATTTTADVENNNEAETDVENNNDAETDVQNNDEAETDVQSNDEAEADVQNNDEAETDVQNNYEAETDMENNDEAETDVENNNEAETQVNKTTRKRMRREENWKRNIRKKLRNSGKSYTSAAGKIMPEKQMGEGCTDKCRLKCKERFSDDSRLQIFDAYWHQGDLSHQRQFIVSFVTRQKKGSNLDHEESRRKQSLQYKLQCPVSNASLPVCKKFFLATLGIKEDTVYGALEKFNSCGTVEQDNRGKHGKQKKVTAEVRANIKEHIESFAVVESHYCRKETSRKYLPSDLSMAKMYRMYEQLCVEKGREIPKQAIYRKIFVTEYNLHFWTPKKDQCDLCTRYKNSAGVLQDELKSKYEEHLEQKEKARAAKEEAKSRAKTDGQTIAACFDLQKVLPCPHGQTSSFYYNRKLSLYNLTVYSLGNGDGYCYIWPETVAKRGANEVASCIYSFLTELCSKGVEKFVFFSDNCSGQNRNKFIATMYWFAVNNLPIESITHNFLEVGHTQNENDSVHSVIERAARKSVIYTPDQWSAVVRNSRSARPYSVKDMTLTDFLDFKDTAKSIKNFEITENGSSVRWTSIRSLEIQKSSPNIMFLKYKYEENFVELNFMRRQRNVKVPSTLKQLRTEKCKISSAKYKDLQKLCQTNLIPPAYHDFFSNLPFIDNASASGDDSDS